MSEIRKNYVIKLCIRILIFIICFIMCFIKEEFIILKGMNFFKEFNPLHILWLIWVFDMLLQVIPIKNKLALGSQKLFAHRFKPSIIKTAPNKIKDYIKTITKSAYKVLIIWVLLIAVIGVLYYSKIINTKTLFMISVFFYVCDLICVLVWCPFRLLMKNKCCTTCRIFNWDHIMMFSPLIFINSFYTLSLVALALLSWGVWELSVLLFPQRFYEITNVSLKCSKCTDKLCTQYCEKKKKQLKNKKR